MCKHILITQFSTQDLDIIREFAERTNENDGYGAIIRTDSTIETLKSLSLSTFYIELTKRALKGDIIDLVVHHRTSTNEPGIDAAHPFEFEGHYLTHNGVVSVPGEHNTKTTNDSEALLHHLVKTNYDTKSIQGYFSCFILTDQTTTILVDDTAPMYTDGRVYCSHNLNNYSKLTLTMRTLAPLSNHILEETPIEVTKTTYGHDKATKSLGYILDAAPTDDDSPWYIPNSEEYSANVRDIVELMTREETETYYAQVNETLAMQYLEDIAYSMGYTLTFNELIDLVNILESAYHGNLNLA